MLIVCVSYERNPKTFRREFLLTVAEETSNILEACRRITKFSHRDGKGELGNLDGPGLSGIRRVEVKGMR
jgi:hypothetical protein